MGVVVSKLAPPLIQKKMAKLHILSGQRSSEKIKNYTIISKQTQNNTQNTKQKTHNTQQPTVIGHGILAGTYLAEYRDLLK